MWFEGKTLIVITGASRGLGQAIAVEMAKTIHESRLLLISRTETGLKVTKEMCLKENNKCGVSVHVADMLTVTKADFESMFASVEFDEFDSMVMVHNAGSLGNQGTKVVAFDSIQEMQDYYRVNVFSAMVLNSVIAHKAINIKNKVVINISSLAAMQPFETWGSYCSGKAARDSLFKVMAAEEPSWLVLNYAPGPLDTKMIQDVLTDSATSEGIKSAFESLKTSNGLLQPCDSAKRLIELLTEAKFKSGDHVDFFDSI